MMEVAVKELERRNDIHVSGNIAIRGCSIDISNGLGYVELSTGKKACVVKVEHVFKGSYTIELEVGTEEFRIGQQKEEEKDYLRKLENQIHELYINPTMVRPQGVGQETQGRDSKNPHFG
jgi:hypothetical protein